MLRLLLPLFLLFSPLWAADPFVVKPYLNLGNNAADATKLDILFHTAVNDDKWTVQVKAGQGKKWGKPLATTSTKIAVAAIEPHLVQAVTVSGLKPGMEFEYQVLRNGKAEFSAKGLARKSKDQPYRFVAFGDCGQDNKPQREIAALTMKQNPDFVFMPGDMVYNRGRISEYRQKFYPIYNSEETPLIRSRVVFGDIGNHDVAAGDFKANPDLQAYFYYWRQPLNGADLKFNGPNTPKLTGSPEQLDAFQTAAADRYPKMLNWSVDYGNAHWLMIDGNPHTSWQDPAMRAWVEDDLKKHQGATWIFVGVHHPGFNSSKAHFSEQQVRWLSDLFEKYHVDMVIAGHVHNYQRSFPMKFREPVAAKGLLVDGKFDLDKEFDGKTKTKPNGVIYIVTGAGGAGLYNPEQEGKPETWQPFTDKFISKTHSLSVVDVKGRELTFRQLGPDGEELDAFKIQK